MAVKLPAPIRAYFDADQDRSGAALVGAFAPDAVVKDEGKTHVGRDAIEAWWRAAKAKYEHTAEPCEIRDEGGLCIVRARVTGRFPGSPALLRFAFQLEDGRIAALEIGA
jgi:SnoaL-like domain